MEAGEQAGICTRGMCPPPGRHVGGERSEGHGGARWVKFWGRALLGEGIACAKAQW